MCKYNGFFGNTYADLACKAVVILFRASDIVTEEFLSRVGILFGSGGFSAVLTSHLSYVVIHSRFGISGWSSQDSFVPQVPLNEFR